MSDNTLDDLILTDPEPESGKSKGILALLSVVIVLIIIGAVLAKMIFSSPDDVNKNATKNPTEVKKDIAINNSMSIASSNNTSSQDNTTAGLDADLAPLDDTAIPSNVDTVTVGDNSKKDVKKATNSEVLANSNQEENTNIPKENTVVVHKVKKVIRKIKPKHIVHKIGGHGNTYIQVGSFSKGPNEKFINKIIKSGFRYRIKEVNGFRRVYIGPFTSSEASRVLGRIKAQISSSAFIKK